MQKSKLPTESESKQQYEICKWLREIGVEHFSVPNEGKRTIQTAMKLKAMGLKSGVHDLILLFPNQEIFFIELKTKKGTHSKFQKAFDATVRSYGFKTALIYQDHHRLAILEIAEALKSHNLISQGTYQLTQQKYGMV